MGSAAEENVLHILKLASSYLPTFASKWIVKGLNKQSYKSGKYMLTVPSLPQGHLWGDILKLVLVLVVDENSGLTHNTHAQILTGLAEVTSPRQAHLLTEKILRIAFLHVNAYFFYFYDVKIT